MESVMKNGFAELSADEMNEVDGGGVTGSAIAFVGLCGAALVGGFNAGRAFIRDLKNKF